MTRRPWMPREASAVDAELAGKRDTLLRLLSRARLALSDEDRARIAACDDQTTLDRWCENVLGATTAAEVLT